MSFLPFVLFSFVITRGGGGISLFSNVFKSALGLVTEASLMLLFLPFMLAMSHVVFQAAIGSEMIGYENIVAYIQAGDTAKIAEMLSFGSKNMLFLAFIGILNIYLLLSTKEIAGWFGINYDDKFANWSKKSFQKSYKWVNKKRKAAVKRFRGGGV